MALPALPLALRRARARRRARDRVRRRLPARRSARPTPRSATTLMWRFAQVLIERLQCDAAPAARRLRRRRCTLSRACRRRWCPCRTGRATRGARPRTRGRSSSSRVDGAQPVVAPGQFTMVYAFGVGEVPISVSGDPTADRLVHTVRAVGAVTQAICATRAPARRARRARPVRARRGRSPRQTGGDVVVVAGGIGLAPLRPVVLRALAAAEPTTAGSSLLYGAPHARRPALPRRARALARPSIDVDVTVDAADAGWRGKVGVVPKLVAAARCSTRRRRRRFVCGPEIMMRFTAAGARSTRGVAPRPDLRLAGAQHALRRSATAATASSARRSSAGDGPVFAGRELEPLARGAGAVSARRKPKLAVWKFASCDGCQLSLLDCEDELLALAGEVEIAHFLEATSAARRGPVRPLARRGLDHDRRTTPSGSRRSAASSKALVTIGACATAGGIQALRNFADVEEFTSARLRLARVRLDARDLDADLAPTSRSTSSCTAARSTSASCSRCITRVPARPPPEHPVDTASASSASGAAPSASWSPTERRASGPVTHAGCGALCPAYDRGCYGCFGPMETPNTAVAHAALRVLGMDDAQTSTASSARSTPSAGVPARSAPSG